VRNVTQKSIATQSILTAATEVYSHKNEDKKAAKGREKLFHVTEATHSLKLFVQINLRLNSMKLA
jgi:hypothetical protein